MEATNAGKISKIWMILITGTILVVLMLVAVAVFTALASSSGGKVLTQTQSKPLGAAAAAKFDINTGTGNLTIDRLASGEGLLASGVLEYLEKQDPPAWMVDARDGQATLTLKASDGRQPGFHLPWAACNGETNWQIHLNPMVSSDITAHSDGGNVKINLAGMAITRVSADSGGGNLDMILPDGASDLSVPVKTGGGNVSVITK